MFAFAASVAVVSARLNSLEPLTSTDTYCYSAAFNTSPNQINRLKGTGKSLTNTKMYASGTATIQWTKSTNTYDVTMNNLNYPAGVYCTDDNVNSGQGGMNEGHECNPMIAAHLHSGNVTANGPASVVFCMGPGLPTHAKVDSIFHDQNDPMFGLCTSSPWSWELTDKYYNPDVVAATGGKGNTKTIAAGGLTTTDSWETLMEDCADASKECLVYFNVHSNYSLTETGGLGLATAQLVPTSC